ncbi:MAG: arylsulfatase [Planctomycetaceae bacterium]|nr:arylsulfatase [Planctomycetaceae bacterium]
MLRTIGMVTLVTVGLASVAVCDEGSSAVRPNVVLIMADDLGFSDLGCYGGEINTPHLDRLANEGLRFTQFYNCAVCVTTRAALMTGLHPRRRERGRWLDSDMTTLAEVLRTAGYRTSLTGKWHLGDEAPNRPTDRGFEEYYGLVSGCCNYFNPAQPDPVFYNGGHVRPFLHNERPVTEFPDGYYTTDAFTDHAVSQIRKFAAERDPFFVHVCYTAPHFPLHALPEDIVRYRGQYDAGYFHMREQRYQRLIELGLIDPQWSLSPADVSQSDFRYDYDITPWEEVTDRVRETRRMEVYAAMVDRLDQGIGRILDAIDETGQSDETLVFFLSDNGGCATYPGYRDDKKRQAREAYNTELPGGPETYDFVAPGWGWAQNAPFRRFKVWTYEGGISTPMIARWPGVIEPASITHQVGHLVDFMPTLVELCGAKYPQAQAGISILPCEGNSLVPVLRGETREEPEAFYWYLYGNRAIRQGRWKLVWGAHAGEWELYDMQTDRPETKNMADQFPERVKAMEAKWLDWANRTNVPLNDTEWDPVVPQRTSCLGMNGTRQHR